jgi:hypothetical protein
MNADEIVRLLDSLAERLTPAAQHVFDIAVRQVVIDGVFNAIILGVIVVLWLAMPFYAKWLWKWSNTLDTYDRGPAKGFGIGIPIAALGATTLFLGPLLLRSALNYLLNPEWQVLLRLSELIP